MTAAAARHGTAQHTVTQPIAAHQMPAKSFTEYRMPNTKYFIENPEYLV